MMYYSAPSSDIPDSKTIGYYSYYPSYPIPYPYLSYPYPYQYQCWCCPYKDQCANSKPSCFKEKDTTP